MSIRNGLFTSESVSEGHPDKLADRISDRILDAFLKRDPDARVACEILHDIHIETDGRSMEIAECLDDLPH